MESDLGKRIGLRIARRRRQAGMTQEALGGALAPSVDAQTVSRWERGTREPSFARLEQIAAAVDATVDQLLGGLDAEPTVKSVELRKLVNLLTGRPKSEIESARRVVQAHLDGLDRLQ